MMRKTKWRLILAVALLVVGLILTIGAMKMLHWNIAALGLPAYDTATYELTDPVSSLTIEAGTADVTIAKTNVDHGRVVCYEKEKQHYHYWQMILLHIKDKRVYKYKECTNY